MPDIYDDMLAGLSGKQSNKTSNRLEDLDDDFRSKIDQLIEKGKQKGVSFKIRETYRPADVQDQYYAQGRTKPGKIITYAKGGQSDHQYRTAIDIDPSDGDYHQLGKWAKELGLKWGGDWKWKDWGHVYRDDARKGRKPVNDTDVSDYLLSQLPQTDKIPTSTAGNNKFSSDDLIDDMLAGATKPSPTNPVNPPRITIPEPEAPNTVAAQIQSTLDPNSPKKATLITPGEQIPTLGGLQVIDVPEGKLAVNPAKGQPRSLAEAIGKVQDVGNNTRGMTVLTTDAQGNELSASIVRDPQAAEKQIELDRQMYPQAVNHELLPSDEVARRRAEITRNPFQSPDARQFPFSMMLPNEMPETQESIRAKQEWEKWGPVYRQFLADEKLEDSPEALKRFNAKMQALSATQREKTRKVARKSNLDAQVGSEEKTYKFDETGVLELENGKKLFVDNSKEVPATATRFRDDEGETYLFDRNTGKLQDESLSDIAETVPVSRVPYTQRVSTPLRQAQEQRAIQVARALATKYGMNEDDAYQWVMQRGFTDPEASKAQGRDVPLPEDRYYESDAQGLIRNQTNYNRQGSSIGAPGTKPPTGEISSSDTHSLTRRQMRELEAFTSEQKAKREQAVLKMISEGREPDAETLRSLGVSLDELRSKQYDEFEMARVKGRVNQADIDRFKAEYRSQGNDERLAELKALQRKGIGGKKVSTEIANYENRRREIAEEVRKYGGLFKEGGYAEKKYGYAPQTQTPEDIDRKVNAQIAKEIQAYGSITAFVNKQKKAEAEERARIERIKNDPTSKKVFEYVKGYSAGVAGSAVEGIGDFVKGFPIWTKPVADYIDSLFGTNHRDLKNHPFTQLGQGIKDAGQFIKDWQSRDYQKEFWAGSIPQDLGSIIAFTPAAAGGPLGISLFATMQMTGSSYDEAIEAGAKPETAEKYAQLVGGLLGWTERFGLGESWQRLIKGQGGKRIKGILLDALKESAEEVFVNELPQSLGQNYLAKLTFDPARQWDKDLADNLGAAGVSAPVASILISGLLHIKHRRQIAQVVKDDMVNGGPLVRDFGEWGVFVSGKQIQVTKELEPLLQKHQKYQKEIQTGFDDIKEAKKRKEAAKFNDKPRYDRIIDDIRREQFRVMLEQQKVAGAIARLSGSVPSIVEQKESAEKQTQTQRVTLKPLNETKAPTPQKPAPVDTKALVQDQPPSGDAPVVSSAPVPAPKARTGTNANGSTWTEIVKTKDDGTTTITYDTIRADGRKVTIGRRQFAKDEFLQEFPLLPEYREDFEEFVEKYGDEILVREIREAADGRGGISLTVGGKEKGFDFNLELAFDRNQKPSAPTNGQSKKPTVDTKALAKDTPVESKAGYVENLSDEDATFRNLAILTNRHRAINDTNELRDELKVLDKLIDKALSEGKPAETVLKTLPAMMFPVIWNAPGNVAGTVADAIEARFSGNQRRLADDQADLVGLRFAAEEKAKLLRTRLDAIRDYIDPIHHDLVVGDLNSKNLTRAERVLQKLEAQAGPKMAESKAEPKSVESLPKYYEEAPTDLIPEAPLRPSEKGFEIVSETGAKATTPVGQLKEQRDEERRKGNTDKLTGLANQNAWEAAKERIESDPEQEVISIDVNRMKDVNDTTSHEGVNKTVLKPIGDAVQKVLEKHGIDSRNGFRTGGDEFTVAVPKGKAQQVRDDIEKAFGVVNVTAEKDFTNTRTGESFKKGDIIPVTISGSFGNTVKEAEVELGKRKEESKGKNPIQRTSRTPEEYAKNGEKVPYEVAGVRFDNVEGVGRVPDNQNVSYKGHTIFMKASDFMNLAASIEKGQRDNPNTLEADSIGTPFLEVEDDGKGNWAVKSHEGRHRIRGFINSKGDQVIPVQIFGRRGHDRAHHLVESDLSRQFIPEDGGSPVSVNGTRVWQGKVYSAKASPRQMTWWELGGEVAGELGPHALRPSQAKLKEVAQSLGISVAVARKALDLYNDPNGVSRLAKQPVPIKNPSQKVTTKESVAPKKKTPSHVQQAAEELHRKLRGEEAQGLREFDNAVFDEQVRKGLGDASPNYIYYTKDARTIPAKHGPMGQTEKLPITKVKLVFSESPLPQDFQTEWELAPIEIRPTGQQKASRKEIQDAIRLASSDPSINTEKKLKWLRTFAENNPDSPHLDKYKNVVKHIDEVQKALYDVPDSDLSQKTGTPQNVGQKVTTKEEGGNILYQPEESKKANPVAKSDAINSRQRKHLGQLLAKYDDTGEISSVAELVDRIEELGVPAFDGVIADFRRAQKEDADLKGRGDVEAEENAILEKLKQIATVSPQSKSATVETRSKEFETALEALRTNADPTKTSQLLGIATKLATSSAQIAEAVKLAETSQKVTTKEEGGNIPSQDKQPWEMTRGDYRIVIRQNSETTSRDTIAELEQQLKDGTFSRSGTGAFGTKITLSEVEARKQTEARLADLKKIKPDWLIESEADHFHKQHVEEALSEGKPVPPEVLADYPDLTNNPTEELKTAETMANLLFHVANAAQSKRTATKIIAQFGREAYDNARKHQWILMPAKGPSGPHVISKIGRDQLRELNNQMGDLRKAATSTAKVTQESAKVQAESKPQTETNNDIEALPPSQRVTPEDLQDDVTFKAVESASLEMPAPDTDAFKSWFGDSKVVDKDGKPLVVYHGTPTGGFTEFDAGQSGRAGDPGIRGKGFYFSNNEGLADMYQTRPNHGRTGIPQTYHVYLSIRNPYDGNKDVLGLLGRGTDPSEIRRKIESSGYDGVIYILPDGKNIEFVAFNRNQIKSAIGNKGTFDPNNPSIFEMPADSGSFKLQEDAQFAHPQDLLDRAKSSITDDGHIELNVEAGELLRRIAGKPNAFFGLTHTRGTLIQLSRKINQKLDEFRKVGYSDAEIKVLTDLADQLREVAKKGAGITYIFDFSLPHETHHQMVLNALNGETIPKETIDELSKLKVWNNPKIKTVTGQTTTFSRLYPRASGVTKAMEIAAMLDTGEITHADKNEFLKIFARGIKSVSTVNPDDFIRIFQYDSQTSDTGRSEAVGSEPETSGSTSEDRQASPTQEEANQEAGTRPGDGQVQRPDSGTEVSVENKVVRQLTDYDRLFKKRKYAETLRENGYEDTPDVPYIPDTEKKWLADAQRRISASKHDDYKTAEKAFYEDNMEPQQRTALGIGLLDHLGSIGELERMIKVSEELVKHVGTAAQALRASQLAGKYDFVTGMMIATRAVKKAGKELTAKDAEKVRELLTRIAQTEEEKASLTYLNQELETAVKEADKNIKELEGALNDAQAERKVDANTIARLKKQIATLKENRPRTYHAKQKAELERAKPDLEKILREAFSLAMTAWHGTPHRFAKFDISKIGTGEGAQAYGWGLYFAGSEAVADHYKNTLAKKQYAPKYKGDAKFVAINKLREAGEPDAKVDAVIMILDAIYEGSTNAIADVQQFNAEELRVLERLVHEYPKMPGNIADRISESVKQSQQINLRWRQELAKVLAEFQESDFSIDTGAKYRVDLKPAEDEYLLWDKPLSEQSEKVKKALEMAGYVIPTARQETDKQVYARVERFLNSKRFDALWREDIGIRETLQRVFDQHEKGVESFARWLKTPEGSRFLNGSYLNTKTSENIPGSEVYGEVQYGFKGPLSGKEQDNGKSASEYLKSLGIRGIKYLDGSSRGKGEGNYNYVIFDDADVEILETFEMPADDRIHNALVDMASLDILNYVSPEDTIEHLRDLTNNMLSEDELREIHLEAFEATKSESNITPEARKNSAVRMAHRRMAMQTAKPDVQKVRERPSRYDKEVITFGRNNGYTDKEILGAILFPKIKGAHAVNEWKQLVDGDDNTFKRSRELRQKVNNDIQDQIIKAKADREGYKGDLEKFKNEVIHNGIAGREARKAFDNYARKLGRSLGRKAFDFASETVSLFKGLSAWGEISYIGRQGFIPLLTDTRAAIKGDWKGVGHGLQGDNKLWQYLADKAGFENAAEYLSNHSLSVFVEQIRQHPRFLSAQNNGVRFTHIGDFNVADDHFSTQLLEKVPFYRRAEVAYTLPGDLQRLYIYDNWATMLEQQNLSADEMKKALKYVAETVNAFTGKGDIGKVIAKGGALSKVLNLALFSPQLLFSRFQSLNKLTLGWATAPKGLKMHMAKKGLRFYGILAVIAALTGMVLDPEDEDFGKINIGDTHADLLAGLDVPAQLYMRTAMGFVKSVINQDTAYLADDIQANIREFGVSKEGQPRFVRSKLSPGASLAVDAYTGTDFIGRPFTWWGGLTSRSVPLAWQQTYDALLYDRYREMVKEPRTFEYAVNKFNENERNYLNALMVMAGTFTGIGITQYPKADRSKAVQLAAQLSPFVSKKDAEQRRIEGGLRNLLADKFDLLKQGKDTRKVDAEIERWMKMNPNLNKKFSAINTQAGSKYGLLSLYLKDLNADQLKRVRSVSTDPGEIEIIDKRIKTLEK